MSEIDVDAETVDFSGQVLDGVDTIRFNVDNSTAIFNGSQFDGVQILDTVTLEGRADSGAETLVIVNDAHRFDASGWVFDNWRHADGVVINGGVQRDHLVGSVEDDRITGGDGRDVLRGGLGVDLLIGGRGADTFVFSSVTDSGPGGGDNIIDFNVGKDTIDLSGIDAIVGGGDDAFHVIGGTTFNGVAGELLALSAPHHSSLVEGDVDGDGIADITFTVRHGTFTAGDFIL